MDGAKELSEGLQFVPVNAVTGTPGTVEVKPFSTICTSSDLCFGDGRFSASLTAKDPRSGNEGSGLPIPQTNLFGYFSLPDLTGNADNPEVFVKVLDGRDLNGKYWVFYGGLTDLEFTLTIIDNQTGVTRTYDKSPFTFCGGADTSAF